MSLRSKERQRRRRRTHKQNSHTATTIVWIDWPFTHSPIHPFILSHTAMNKKQSSHCTHSSATEETRRRTSNREVGVGSVAEGAAPTTLGYATTTTVSCIVPPPPPIATTTITSYGRWWRYHTVSLSVLLFSLLFGSTSPYRHFSCSVVGWTGRPPVPTPTVCTVPFLFLVCYSRCCGVGSCCCGLVCAWTMMPVLLSDAGLMDATVRLFSSSPLSLQFRGGTIQETVVVVA